MTTHTTADAETSEPRIEVGGRYLLRRLWSHPRSYEEHAVQEISPSGSLFKSGNQWLSLDDYRIVERLSDRKQP